MMAVSGILAGAAALGGAWLVTRYAFHAALTAQTASIPIIAAGMAAFAMPRGASRTPLEIAMPWSAVRGVAVGKDERGAPILHVLTDEAFPARAIYFRPADLNTAIMRLDAARSARA